MAAIDDLAGGVGIEITAGGVAPEEADTDRSVLGSATHADLLAQRRIDAGAHADTASQPVPRQSAKKKRACAL